MGASNYLSQRPKVGHRRGHLTAAQNGAATFDNFAAAGVVPLAAYLLPVLATIQFPVAVLLTRLTLIGVGAACSIVTEGTWDATARPHRWRRPSPQ